MTENAVSTAPESARYGGRCLHCRRWITADTAKAWAIAVRAPCPHCGRKGW